MFTKFKHMFSVNKISSSKIVDRVYMPSDSFENFLNKLNMYFEENPVQKTDFLNELHFLNHLSHIPEEEKKLYSVMPYPFINKYRYQDVEVFRDEEAGMFFVYLDGKKLYYHKGYTSAEAVQKSFTYISAEQDIESPHRYVDNKFFVKEGDTVIDLGAAEGNFSLSVVHKAKELFIIEADNQWIPALQKTFSPWISKVHIINKFAGVKTSQTQITLTELSRQSKIDVIKMDIEGAEMSLLQEAKDYITQNNLRMAITTYHHHNDAQSIEQFLSARGYQTAFSDRFILFIYDSLAPPYFRKGLLKAVNL